MNRNRPSEEDIKALGERLFGDRLRVKGLSKGEIGRFAKELTGSRRIVRQYVLDVRITARPQFVKLIAELSATTLRLKLDKELALWYCLRSVIPAGSGTLVLDHAIRALTGSFAYSQRTVYRTLQAGTGKFWDIEYDLRFSRSVIRIYGVARVAEHLGTYHLSWPVRIVAAKFRGLKNRRAQLYASFLSLKATGQSLSLGTVSRLPQELSGGNSGDMTKWLELGK